MNLYLLEQTGDAVGKVVNMDAISTAMVTAITTIAEGATGAIAAVVPVAAPVMGGMIMVGVAIKAVRRFMGR